MSHKELVMHFFVEWYTNKIYEIDFTFIDSDSGFVTKNDQFVTFSKGIRDICR